MKTPLHRPEHALIWNKTTEQPDTRPRECNIPKHAPLLRNLLKLPLCWAITIAWLMESTYRAQRADRDRRSNPLKGNK